LELRWHYIDEIKWMAMIKNEVKIRYGIRYKIKGNDKGSQTGIRMALQEIWWKAMTTSEEELRWNLHKRKWKANHSKL